MDNQIPIDTRQINALLRDRAWTRARLLAHPDIEADALRQAEAGGAAPYRLACALADALEVSPALLSHDSVPARRRRERRRYVIAFCIALVFLAMMALGYRVGADRAQRDNRAGETAELDRTSTRAQASDH